MHRPELQLLTHNQAYRQKPLVPIHELNNMFNCEEGKTIVISNGTISWWYCPRVSEWSNPNNLHS